MFLSITTIVILTFHAVSHFIEYFFDQFIASRYLGGSRFALLMCGHRGIENYLYWVLGVTFDEDETRSRERHLVDDLSWLRRFAINLLEQHPLKHSVKGKSEIAGWNNKFLLQVLATQQV